MNVKRAYHLRLFSEDLKFVLLHSCSGLLPVQLTFHLPWCPDSYYLSVPDDDVSNKSVGKVRN